jgi:plastocyanin domain-containing protein
VFLTKNGAEKIRAIRQILSVFYFPTAHGRIWFINRRCAQKKGESKMDFEQRNGKETEMTIIDGMPASILTGTDRTPAPWEE